MKLGLLKNQYLVSIIAISGVAALCFPFTDWIGYRSVALLLLLTVSILAMRLSLYPVLIAATMSALIWDFFFIPPVFTFVVHNPSVSKGQILSELVTASGSGLDPHLSPQGVMIQIPRIAKSRGISEAKLKDLVGKNTVNPVIGTSTVNILSLNIALDGLK